jgi:competence protein ComEC
MKQIWNKNTFILVIILLVSLDVLVWRTIIFAKTSDNLEIYFLSVGQGDSELVVLPGGVQVLIDGGKGNYAVQELTLILPFFDRYLDLVILSHPEIDHFLGLIEVLRNYQVGTFISNGRPGTADSWPVLAETLNKEKIPKVSLAAGDKICYQENCFNILSPTKEFLTGRETNDSGLVMRFSAGGSQTLFTGDTGEKVEDFLIKNYDVRTDILKVSHHGSKFSTSQKFLAASQPRLAFIEVGKNNYGHPTQEVLSRLASIGSAIYRTDTDGTIKLVINKGHISIFKKRPKMIY